MSKIEQFPVNFASPPRPQDLPGALPVFEAEEQHRALLTQLRAIWSRKWSILALTLIAGVVGLFEASSMPSIYRAEAKLLVSFNQPSVAGVQQVEATPLYWHFYETQSDIIRSRVVAQGVVDRLGLSQFG